MNRIGDWIGDRIKWLNLASIRIFSVSNLVFYSRLSKERSATWFEWLSIFFATFTTKSVSFPINMSIENFSCPCCGHKTFDGKPDGTYAICPVCFWEDDPIQLNDIDFEGGANRVSLRQGQRNFLEFGACEKRTAAYVRKPRADEERDEGWRMLTDLVWKFG